jgi:hypothetical protein
LLRNKTRMLLNTLPWQQQRVRLQPYKHCKRNFCISAQYVAVSDTNMPFHSCVRFYPNSLTPFGSKTRNIWRFYVTLSSITYLGLRAKCSVFLSDFNKFGLYRHNFIIVFDNKSYENPSNGSTVHIFGHKNGRTDMRFTRWFSRLRDGAQRARKILGDFTKFRQAPVTLVVSMPLPIYSFVRME